MAINTERIEELIRALLVELGEDPKRDGLLETPRRVASAFEFLTQGYRQGAREVFGHAFFEMKTDGMVVVRDIELYSLCEHHMLPFFGRCHVGYRTKDKVPGCSKIARIVDVYARRLQIQERLTGQIADAVEEFTHAEGVGVMIEARHLCVMMRGVEKRNSVFITSSLRGTFRQHELRDEFLAVVGRDGPQI